MSSSVEWFPVVNEDGKEIYTAPRTLLHNGRSMLLHPVVHLHLFNKQGELFLQKRAMIKDLLPGKWDTSVGGHINPGENVETALSRETEEELGLKNFKFRFQRRYIWESLQERELVYSFTGISDDKPEINREEIDEGRFWTMQEIIYKQDTGIFTPNFENEFRMLFLTDPDRIDIPEYNSY